MEYNQIHYINLKLLYGQQVLPFYFFTETDQARVKYTWAKKINLLPFWNKTKQKKNL